MPEKAEFEKKGIEDMNATTLHSLWDFLQGLSLTRQNKQWLASKLIEQSTQVGSTLHFPKISKDFKVSEMTLKNVAGPLPEGFDVEKELAEMWEDMAQ